MCLLCSALCAFCDLLYVPFVAKLFFFSKIANVRMIVAPVAIPKTYHSHVQPKLTDAYQIIVTIDNNRKIVPRSSMPRMRNTIPAKMPASENDPSINGSHGE